MGAGRGRSRRARSFDEFFNPVRAGSKPIDVFARVSDDKGRHGHICEAALSLGGGITYGVFWDDGTVQSGIHADELKEKRQLGEERIGLLGRIVSMDPKKNPGLRVALERHQEVSGAEESGGSVSAQVINMDLLDAESGLFREKLRLGVYLYENGGEHVLGLPLSAVELVLDTARPEVERVGF